MVACNRCDSNHDHDLLHRALRNLDRGIGETPGASEFSHGPGLRPKHLDEAAPEGGGRYRGKSPGRH